VRRDRISHGPQGVKIAESELQLWRGILKLVIVA
jgi:hypothetical protein